MKYLIFDTETTGLLPRKFDLNKSNITELPYIVQLSFIIYDNDLNKVLTTYDAIIKMPDGVYIPDESSKIHGITNGISLNKGVFIKDVLEIFKVAVENADYIVAHNFEFDINMICIECIRNNMEIELLLNDPFIFCTMKSSKDLCNIEAISKNGDKYIKYPKLIELHDKLFNIKPKNLHNSFNDVIVCLRCFYYMRHDIDICEINKKVKMLYNKCCK